MAESHRLFNCARCRRLVRICTSCDRGNIYCPDCAEIARHERTREARLRYQRTERGRLNHKVQQQLYLHRQEKMMDQGPSIEPLELLPRARPAAKVLGQPIGREEVPDESESEVTFTPEEVQTSAAARPAATLRCDFCGRPCGDFARRAPLRRRSRVQSRRRPRPPGYRRLGP